ncbi:transposase, partial [Nitrosococcus oceani C-27]
IGVDLGVKVIVVTSEGWKSGNPRHLRKIQRGLSRKRKGSHRWHRQRIRVAKAHARVSNTRQDWLHKLSTVLIRQAGFIAMEDLNVRGMMANRRLAKALGDVGMHELKRQLAYKAKWYGRALVQVDRWAPTSKTCSACGTVIDVMALKVREWRRIPTGGGRMTAKGRPRNANGSKASEAACLCDARRQVGNKRTRLSRKLQYSYHQLAARGDVT